MNINCIICSDLFSPAAKIYTTTCGHIFHQICLIQWLERSHSCPQCRNKATEKTIHRLYFNFNTTESIVDDLSTLQHKVDNLQFQLRLKDKDIKVNKEKYKNIKKQNVALREKIEKSSHKTKVLKTAIHALKMKEVKYYDREKAELKNKIKQLEEKLLEKNVIGETYKSSGLTTKSPLLFNDSPVQIIKPAVLQLPLYKSPGLAEKVETIVNSDSPYLPLKSSSVQISDIYKNNTKLPNTSNFKSTTTVNCSTSKHYSFDGYGGQKQKDACSTISHVSLKRSSTKKPSYSKKFRKLASNKKISNFINLDDTDA